MEPAARQLRKVTAATRGASVAAARTGALIVKETRPIAEIVPFQLLSVLLAQRRGLEPGAFRQIGKVTTTL
jgi:glucosamine 6-phosphate synthetase-like amidotransferase/phosphosugar isomerase protein